jgi:hypothetical protein
MMPETYNFSGDLVTVLGFIGVVSTAFILVAVYKAYWKSPYRK